jgi:hypothetical protein
MAKYSVAGNAGSANTTAATAGLAALYNPASTSTVQCHIVEFEIGPQANSADNTYGVQLKRFTGTVGVGTGFTPSANDGHSTTSLALAYTAQTTAFGTPGVVLASFGYHMRGGYRYVPIPGGEFTLQGLFGAAIVLSYIFTQSTDVQSVTIVYEE